MVPLINRLRALDDRLMPQSRYDTPTPIWVRWGIPGLGVLVVLIYGAVRDGGALIVLTMALYGAIELPLFVASLRWYRKHTVL